MIRRTKLRNCIRPDTFRYHGFGESDFPAVWERLEACYGKAIRFGAIELYEIDAPAFLLRSVAKDQSITLIKKGDCPAVEERRFWELIGFSPEVRDE